MCADSGINDDYTSQSQKYIKALAADYVSICSVQKIFMLKKFS